MAQPDRIPVRELRNNVSQVLRRVEAGESLEVTVNDRPVALLTPRSARASTVNTREFLGSLVFADPGLRTELADELTETTDDVADPWS
ncbi:MAG: type II toxin-antitoxin system Phd/YefM family antitoxin [Micromonosporaceae bacterium]